MDAASEQKVKTLDVAIEECAMYIRENSRRATVVLLLLLMLGAMILLILASIIIVPYSYDIIGRSTYVTSIGSGLLIFISIIIGVLVSLYRFHMLEIARTEHYKIGFMRIRIAANNKSEGFGTEVRKALTEGAFTFEFSKPLGRGKIESPLPGHPTSDISTALINKVLDGLDVMVKPKK